MRDSIAAFIYLTIRKEFVEGASASPVVYIAGLYVEQEYINSGIGKNLVDEGEQRGLKEGCSQ